MADQKVQDIVSHIDYIIAELKHLRSKVTLEDGIHFNVLIKEPKGDGEDLGMFAIELWDSELLEPRILSYYPEHKKFDDRNKECMLALNQLGLRAFKKQIYWNSDHDWEDLPENFRKLDQVYKIEKRKLSDTVRNELKGRINALYHV